MSKVLIGVFSGIFIGAVIYELINRTNPELIKKVEEFASHKIDDVCGVKIETVAEKAHEAA
ncbi:MAG: hypothetical protein ACOYL3_00055 [Desulfuromonadaceae bacterium]